jgi:hypothetical protein
MAFKSRTAHKPAVMRRATTKKLHFVESMECLPVAKLPAAQRLPRHFISATTGIQIAGFATIR